VGHPASLYFLLSPNGLAQRKTNTGILPRSAPQDDRAFRLDPVNCRASPGLGAPSKRAAPEARWNKDVASPRSPRINDEFLLYGGCAIELIDRFQDLQPQVRVNGGLAQIVVHLLRRGGGLLAPDEGA
jgi:hypothetical protein